MKPPKPVPSQNPVPFAESDVTDAVWPVETKLPKRFEVTYEDVSGEIIGSSPARRFLAGRKNGRYHVGLDVYGSIGDLVRACEDGVIVNFYEFYENTWALFVEHEDFVVNYGEVSGKSLQAFGLTVGSKVKKGQSIARVGRLNSGNSMVHFETYRRGTKTNKKWYKGEKRPAELLNPTRYLLALAAQEAGAPAPELPPLEPALQPVVLRSPALSSDATLQEIAEGRGLLKRSPGVRQPGVAALQRAFNLLAGKKPAYRLDLGVGDIDAGIFGARTEKVVETLQKEAGVGVDGKVGRDTLKALDEALYQVFGGLVVPVAAEDSAAAPAAPAADAAVLIESQHLPQPAGDATVTDTKTRTTKEWKGGFVGNSSHTTGSTIVETTYSDGTVISEYTETLEAQVDGRKYGPRKAGQIRVKKGNVTIVEQRNYAWLNRDFPRVVLIEDHPGFGDGDHEEGLATFFGKNDETDAGCGTPSYEIVQTNSDVLGASLKQARMEKLLGGSWAKISRTPELLGVTVEVYYPETRKFARVPLVDVGPDPKLEAEIDLSQSLNEFLGGSGKSPMHFRVILAET